MGARPARDEVAQRVLHRLEKLPRKPRWRRDAERIADAGRVLRRDPSLLAGEVQRKGAALLEQLLQRRVAFEPPPHLRLGKVAEREQQIVEPVDSVRRAGQALGRVLVLVDGTRVEQLAHLRLAQQLTQLGLVDGERLRAALGERGVAVVDEVRDIAEEQRSGERRGRARVDGDDAQAAVLHATQRLLQPGKVEDVAQAFPVRLQQQRKAAVPRGDLEQIARPLSLRPERAAPARMSARQEQRPRRVLAEARGEERGRPQRLHHEVLDFVRAWKEQLRLGRRVGFGDAEDHAVVGPHRLHFQAAVLLQPAHDGGGPGRMHARAERGQHADAPVADLVDVALDNHRLVAGNLAGGIRLVVQVLQEI